MDKKKLKKWIVPMFLVGIFVVLVSLSFCMKQASGQSVPPYPAEDDGMHWVAGKTDGSDDIFPDDYMVRKAVLNEEAPVPVSSNVPLLCSIFFLPIEGKGYSDNFYFCHDINSTKIICRTEKSLKKSGVIK